MSGKSRIILAAATALVLFLTSCSAGYKTEADSHRPWQLDPGLLGTSSQTAGGKSSQQSKNPTDTDANTAKESTPSISGSESQKTSESEAPSADLHQPQGQHQEKKRNGLRKRAHQLTDLAADRAQAKTLAELGVRFPVPELPDPQQLNIPAEITPVELPKIEDLDTSWLPEEGLAAEQGYDGPTVYLTIDDGPSTDRTPKVLSILHAYGVPATFFAIGQNITAETYGVILRTWMEGHMLANHSYDHYDSGCNARHFAQSVALQSEMVRRITGFSPRMFRFAGGSNSYLNQGALAEGAIGWLRENNYNYCDWNASSGDGDGAVLYTGQQMSDNVFSSYIFNYPDTAKHVVVLCHDSQAGSMKRHDIFGFLPIVIKEFARRGYKFATLERDGFTTKYVNP